MLLVADALVGHARRLQAGTQPKPEDEDVGAREADGLECGLGDYVQGRTGKAQELGFLLENDGSWSRMPCAVGAVKMAARCLL